ncbi:MAG: SusC/RagA family TonB-linked outer membrane protein [Muribaculaceae bacterium]|nr:SusC/RagA family TonB-linked outer membrane protein [Muribaculaceae bacterium]
MNIKQSVSLLAVACLAAMPFNIAAQTTGTPSSTLSKIAEKNIVGTVCDNEGEPLAGASVIIEGTSQGVSTDVDGNFTILSSQKNPVLLITYIGMNPMRIEVPKDYHLLEIKMTPQSNMMEEVVVTGYQTIKRESATGSYQTITSEDINKRFTGDLVSNLEGKVPGLVGAEKGESEIVIRGLGSFSAQNSPLIVVDGLPIEGGLETVNPYDVENITVLKDAAASSIYGARASAGVIVITTKTAKKERLTVDFNADLTISEKTDYSDLFYATGAEAVQLELYNFNGMINDENDSYLNSALTRYKTGKMSMLSPVMRVLLGNYVGDVSDADMNRQLNYWRGNNYMDEFQKIHDRNRVTQNYNIALRMQGKVINSSIMLNYARNNMGVQKEHSDAITLKYKGDIKAAKWLDISLGLNVISNRSKTHAETSYLTRTAFLPYMSIYDIDGNPAGMECGVYPGEKVFADAGNELKDPTFNLLDEMNYNIARYRNTNIRSYIHALFKILPGWTAQAQFQYEDIQSKTETVWDKDSYRMRTLYNYATTVETKHIGWEPNPDFDWTSIKDIMADMENPEIGPEHVGERKVYGKAATHHVPDGGVKQSVSNQASYYTFRGQTRYNRDFGPHQIDVLGGMEYRENHTTGDNYLVYGYNPETLNNSTIGADWNYISTPYTGILGADYAGYENMFIFRPASKFNDILHRFYSIYFTGNYVYDRRYSISGSYRVDKCDLFGADPKFRGRPLWSVGASWNMQNENFMRPYTWIDALKLRASYGLTGNIDSSVSSYLVATISTQYVNNLPQGTVQTPPNDQLRWEKTSTWNAGVDFAFWNYRLSGSFDYYHKAGSDLLTDVDLDMTTGYETLKINAGNMVNNGIELQLNGHILEARRRNDIAINLGFNFAYNKNKVTKIHHFPSSGTSNLSFSLHEGYPLNSLFSIKDRGMVEKGGGYYTSWEDKDGNLHVGNVSSELNIEDCVYSGSTTPKFSGALTPQISWNGLTLEAMFAFYGGHYMRTGAEHWSNSGSECGYTSFMGSGSINSEMLKFWEGDKTYPGNGYKGTDYATISHTQYFESNVVHADYMKLRNLVLTYAFPSSICRKIGFDNLRLRFQMNNVCTWARNSLGIDPEAISMTSGSRYTRTPRSYTMSLYFNL